MACDARTFGADAETRLPAHTPADQRTQDLDGPHHPHIMPVSAAPSSFCGPWAQLEAAIASALSPACPEPTPKHARDAHPPICTVSCLPTCSVCPVPFCPQVRDPGQRTAQQKAEEAAEASAKAAAQADAAASGQQGQQGDGTGRMEVSTTPSWRGQHLCMMMRASLPCAG